MKQITLTYYGFEGTGRTVTEAKHNAGAHIQALATGSWTPYTRTCMGYRVIVWRALSGWYSTIRCPDSPDDTGQCLWGTSYTPDETREEVIDAANYNLAQLAWMPEQGEHSPFPLPTHQRANWASWVEFQLRYKRAIQHGLSSTDAHSYAGRNPAGYIDIDAA